MRILGENEVVWGPAGTRHSSSRDKFYLGTQAWKAAPEVRMLGEKEVVWCPAEREQAAAAATTSTTSGGCHVEL
jgi:hypothetical protein